jgi:hypothetical protein
VALYVYMVLPGDFWIQFQGGEIYTLEPQSQFQKLQLSEEENFKTRGWLAVLPTGCPAHLLSYIEHWPGEGSGNESFLSRE